MTTFRSTTCFSGHEKILESVHTIEKYWVEPKCSKALHLRNWEHCWDLSKCFPLLTWNKDSKIWRSEVKGVLLNFLWRLGSKSMVTMTAENTFSTFYCEDLAHSLSRRVPKGLDSGFTHFSNIITLCHIRFLLFSLFFLLSFFFF